MAIVPMKKILLMGMTYHKEKILNALHKTGCVELSATEEFADTFRAQEVESSTELSHRLADYSRAVEFATEIIEKSKGKPYYPASDKYFSEVFISYDEFISTPEKESELSGRATLMHEYEAKLGNMRAEKIKLNNLRTQLLAFSDINEKFSDFSDTETSCVFFGTVKREQLSSLNDLKNDTELAEVQVLSERQNAVVLIVCLKEVRDTVQKKLSETAFVACPFAYDVSAQEKLIEIDLKLKEIADKEEEIYKAICTDADLLKDLKILADYYAFLVEKEKDAENFRCTGKTFLLQGYIPAGKEDEVKTTVSMVSDAVFIEYSEPDENDNPPTLTKNDKLVTQTEFVTDLYSVPNYREVDPNKAVFFFFMLFMGVIIADIGYGLIMIVLGITLASRIKVDNGTRRLWYLVAIGGFFSIIFGALFNSLFGVAILPFNILPSPVPDGTGTDGLMTILLGCLALGVVHIASGYFIKALNCFRHKDIAGGIFDGLLWVIFFIGFILASFNFLVGYLMPDAINTMNPGIRAFFEAATMPGVIIVGVTVLLAALTAGRNEKGFGKFSKGFGAVYGLINLMSDILSYARLFGLMLSGMIIATTFNDIGGSLISGGGLGYVFGPIVMGLGHTFNIAMGVLGAYIHDSRLQYIEFFSKFYTGEGEKFAPLGSDMKYIYLTK